MLITYNLIYLTLARRGRSLPCVEVPTSVLRCSFSNKLMDEQDAPCVLPNGRAVCKSLITRLAADLYGRELPLSAWLDLDAAIGDYDVRDAVIEDFRICQVIVS